MKYEINMAFSSENAEEDLKKVIDMVVTAVADFKTKSDNSELEYKVDHLSDQIKRLISEKEESTGNAVRAAACSLSDLKPAFSKLAGELEDFMEVQRSSGKKS